MPHETAQGERTMKTYTIVIEINRYHIQTRTVTMCGTFDQVVAIYNRYAERNGYAILSIVTAD
jgi:hypothetical protein